MLSMHVACRLAMCKHSLGEGMSHTQEMTSQEMTINYPQLSIMQLASESHALKYIYHTQHTPVKGIPATVYIKHIRNKAETLIINLLPAC